MSGFNFEDFNVNVSDVNTKNSPFTSSDQNLNQSAFQDNLLAGNVGDDAKTETFDEKKSNFLSFSYYQRYFDVDTVQVYQRILHSFLPTTKIDNFITNYVQPIPDLYGPFWICATLVFSIAIFGNFAHYIQSTDVSSFFENDFRLVTSSTTLIFCYVILVPFFIYSFIWHRKSLVQYSYLEIVCAYGYSLTIFIPVSMLWIVQIYWFRWLLIIVSVFGSGFVLAISFWPVVKDDINRILAYSFIAGILFLHTLLAVGFKEFYFDSSMPSERIYHDNETPLTDIASTSVGKVSTLTTLNLLLNYDGKNLELNATNNVVDVVQDDKKNSNRNKIETAERQLNNLTLNVNRIVENKSKSEQPLRI